MKVLFDHPDPFSLAHGGFQIQIEQTRAALMEAGIEVEFLEWWNAKQKGDIIHYFGRPNAEYIRFAHKQNCKVVLGEILTGAGSRSRRALAMQRICTTVMPKFLPGFFTARMGWESYRIADACIALTSWEAHLMNYLFGAPKERVHVVPIGIEELFFNSPVVPRGEWLLCTVTIAERKRVLELAEAAVIAQTPLWVIGKPYAESDPYFQSFAALAEKNPKLIRYEKSVGGLARMAEILRAARGFALLSTMETRSMASESAAACECPLLLSDLPWAHSVYGDTATYCPIADTANTARHLRAFYDRAPSLPKPTPPKTWTAVGRQLADIYAGLLKTSR
jgi:glycosyltransferase involved in cell wall biosynthesis